MRTLKGRVAGAKMLFLTAMSWLTRFSILIVCRCDYCLASMISAKNCLHLVSSSIMVVQDSATYWNL